MMTEVRIGVFRHEALLYESDDEFDACVRTFLADAVRRGEPAFALVSAEKAARLRAALGPDADGVEFVDVDEVGRNPCRLIDVWQTLASAHGAATALRGVADPFAHHTTSVERDECIVCDALLNDALVGVPLWLVCAYDVSRHDDGELARACDSHPFVQSHGATRVAAHVATATDLLASPLSEPEAVATDVEFDVNRLRVVRADVRDAACAFGLDDDRTAGLVLTVSEVATNSVLYGGGTGRLRTWVDDAGLVCEVRDAGHIREPLAGRVRPEPGRPNGYGLWIAHQLCDLVQVRSGEAGTVVRLRMLR